MNKPLHPNIPFIDRDSFLTPFDKLFDQVFETSFPDIARAVGVKPYQGSAYPKVNVYEYEDRVGIIAEIPGLDKKDLMVEVQQGTKNPEHTKSLYFGSDTILQNGQHLLICRKVIDVEFEMIEK